MQKKREKEVNSNGLVTSPKETGFDGNADQSYIVATKGVCDIGPFDIGPFDIDTFLESIPLDGLKDVPPKER